MKKSNFRKQVSRSCLRDQREQGEKLEIEKGTVVLKPQPPRSRHQLVDAGVSGGGWGVWWWSWGWFCKWWKSATWILLVLQKKREVKKKSAAGIVFNRTTSRQAAIKQQTGKAVPSSSPALQSSSRALCWKTPTTEQPGEAKMKFGRVLTTPSQRE